ncbi:MAG: tetratricopeptide repeat protein, partial [Bryobacterales bacterium]|nr:tetratricopeptide repeat protein [Bryobacterales bacterium]
RERLNYGLALLRAGKTDEGLAQLRQVQAKDPSLPHTWFNLGIAYKKAGETEKSIEQFERMVQLVPNDAVSHYNLGVLYKLQGRLPDAQEKFRLAAQLAPSLAAPHFQLYNAYRLSGQRDQAAKELAAFQQLKKAAEASGVGEDMEWNDYAEVYDPIDAPPAAPLERPNPMQFQTRKLSTRFPVAGSLLVNLDADDKPDLLVWSPSGDAVVYLAGMNEANAPSGHGFATGDTNNDGTPELLALTKDGAALHDKGKVTPLAQGAFTKAVFVDVDHDYDLDILLFGGKSVFLRNQGEAGFADATADFPFSPGTPIDAAVFRLIPDTKNHDILVTYNEHEAVLYRDRLAGKYEAIPVPEVPAGATKLAFADFNNDSTLDLAFQSKAGGLHLLANKRSQWQEQPVTDKSAPPVFCDFANNGVAEPCEFLDLLSAADFDNDGRQDYIRQTKDGLELLTNATTLKNRYLGIRLLGTKNIKVPLHSEVEVRAGRHYQKQIYRGVPLLFGLRNAEQIDTVRITWPNGMIQNEAKQLPGRYIEVKEAPRLSGSCPMIYTWDGRQFTFLTDALGVAPLGASSGEGEYFPTDHDEYVFIPGKVLQPKDGHYEIRVTEELGEVTYLDQLKLIAVDHPAKIDIFHNDKWKSPPYPGFKLYGTQARLRPVNAPALQKVDGTYAGPAQRTPQNTAETHALDLVFPATSANPNLLVLTGWVDWADGSTFRQFSQIPDRALTPPYLQMRNAKGQWQTVIEDLGLPSGKTKTIAVDLTGKWLSASRDLRIVTNLCIYWDEIFLSDQIPPQARLTTLPTTQAHLDYHGFSTPIIHPTRQQPETFLYHQQLPEAPWNPTPGLYTKYGDIRPLLANVDDQYAILGSGDEIRLRYKALPPPLPGHTRDFLLYFDGWAKDSDPNTAYSQSVTPLPFHKMSRYPYPDTEAFPNSPAHQSWQRNYNKRPALRFVRPLQVAP